MTYLLFSFHFLYDEFVLQQEERILSNLFSALAPFGLITLYLLSEFFNLHTAFGTFLLIGATALVLEALYVREVNWFIIQTKLLSIFILSSIYLRISPYSVVNVFIISHYFFWFIYPVYKLHKYKPSERDGLIIVLLILAVSSLYSSTTSVTAVNQLGSLDIFTRLFFTGTIIHIFTTAPFAYFMGMPKSVPLPSAIRAS